MAGANDERMAHLMRAMNRLLDRHPQSRRRHLAWHTPAIVPVWPQVRGGAAVELGAVAFPTQNPGMLVHSVRLQL